MRWADLRRLLALPLLGCLSVHAQDNATYGKVETFEPGKKYSCVPTPDRKGWDCTQSGKATDKPSEPPRAPAKPPPARTETAPAPPPPTIAAPPPAAATPPAPSTRASELPSYLNARGAAAPRPAAPAPVPPPAAAPAPAPAPAPEAAAVSSTPAAAPAPAAHEAPPIAAPSAQPAQPSAATATPSTPASDKRTAPAPADPPPAPPAVETAPPAASAAAQVVPRTHGTNTNTFLALPGEQYVIELAHGANESELTGAAVPDHGEVYKLHLRQNGAEQWLLVWGSFPDVGAARAARAEITQGTPGWPRRIAPLQAEVRRAGD